jgi:hypothetical protein
MQEQLPDYTVQQMPKLPTQSKYAKYHKAVAGLKDGEVVVVEGLDQKTLWKIQSNTENDLVVIATRSIKEDDGTYTLYMTKKEITKKGGK